ncbi:MAG TPA: hypothetical protein VLH19_01330 [Patescibacteria group bacterium]|nr:hypothetical protein [Patescibacteria group bacterium]
MNPIEKMRAWEKMSPGIIGLAAAVNLSHMLGDTAVVYIDDGRYDGVTFTKKEVIAARELLEQEKRT